MQIFFSVLHSFPIHTYRDICLVLIFKNNQDLFPFSAVLMLAVKAHISAPLTAPILFLVKRQYLQEKPLTFNNMLLVNWRSSHFIISQLAENCWSVQNSPALSKFIAENKSRTALFLSLY